MSANINRRVIIDVTRGDCVEENRKSGKSNTGTYFIGSIKNFDEFSTYINSGNEYKFNLLKIEIYANLFEKYFFNYKEEYIGKMSKFKGYINYMLSLKENPKVDLTLRKNDSRVFMRFIDNTNSIVNAFRNILYEDLSLIVIERIKNIYYIYPIINENFIQLKKNYDSGLIIDEEDLL